MSARTEPTYRIVPFKFSQTDIMMMESWITDGYFNDREELVATAVGLLSIAVKEVELKKGSPMNIESLEFDITLSGTHPH